MSLGILHTEIGRYRLQYTNSDRSTGTTDTTLTRRTSFFNALVTAKNTLLRRSDSTADNTTLNWRALGPEGSIHKCSIGVRVSDNFYTKNHKEQCTELASMRKVQEMLSNGYVGLAYYVLYKNGV